MFRGIRTEKFSYFNKELSESSTTGMQVRATWKGWQDHAITAFERYDIATPARCTTGEPN